MALEYKYELKLVLYVRHSGKIPKSKVFDEYSTEAMVEEFINTFCLKYVYKVEFRVEKIGIWTKLL